LHLCSSVSTHADFTRPSLLLLPSCIFLSRRLPRSTLFPYTTLFRSPRSRSRCRTARPVGPGPGRRGPPPGAPAAQGIAPAAAPCTHRRPRGPLLHRRPASDTELMMEFLDAVFGRRTTNGPFRPDPVRPEHQQLLIRAAAAAPSQFNSQPWRFVLIEEPSTIGEIARI